MFASLKRLLARGPKRTTVQAPVGVIRVEPAAGCVANANGRVGSQNSLQPADPSSAIVFRRYDRLPAGQGTAVRTVPEAVKGVFARLPDEMLLAVAQSMVELAPLNPVPHWHFGDFIQSPDIAVHVRHALWQAARERGLQGTIRMPWHGGTRLDLRLGHDLSLGLLTEGRVEPNEFALLDRILRPGMVFLDAGANEGIYTLFASAKVGLDGRVIAVEPSPRELVHLRTNLHLNSAHNVDVVEQALAEHRGTLRLLLAEERHSGQNTLGDFAYPSVVAAAAVQVTVTTVDQIANELELERLDVIKLDLEGAEIRALAGASRSLERFKPLIFVEALELGASEPAGIDRRVADAAGSREL